jgi:hypothetical protein
MGEPEEEGQCPPPVRKEKVSVPPEIAAALSALLGAVVGWLSRHFFGGTDGR